MNNHRAKIAQTMNSEVTMNRVCLPVIAIALGIVAFCAIENTFNLIQDDAMKKYVGKEINFRIIGVDSTGEGTLIDVNQHNLTIDFGSIGEVCYNREDILLIKEQP